MGFSFLFVSWALLVSAVGCVVLWPALRSLFCAWLFRSLVWFCCRSLADPVSRSVSCGFPLGPQLVSPSLVSPSVFRSWLFFSAIGHLLGRWLSLPVDGRGVGCVSSRSLVRLGLGSLSPPALLSVLPVGFVLRCYSPEPAEPEGKERDGPRQGPRRRPRRCYDHDAGDGHDAGDNHDADPFFLWIPRRYLPDCLFSFKVHNFHFVLHISSLTFPCIPQLIFPPSALRIRCPTKEVPSTKAAAEVALLAGAPTAAPAPTPLSCLLYTSPSPRD